MKKTLLSVAMMAVMSTSVFAATPPEVLEPYRAYNAAMEKKDYKTALKQGKSAWKAAEKKLGDTKVTGDLAFNYGFLEKARGDAGKAVEALERAVELAMIDREKGAEVRLERAVELVSALETDAEFKDAQKQAESSLKFAKDNGLDRSIFAGELLLHKANACNRLVAGKVKMPMMGVDGASGSRFERTANPREYLADQQKKCGKEAEKALDIFRANPKLARAPYVASAANLVGFGHERSGDWLEAALTYQKARDAIEPVYGRDNALVAQTIGRWLNARSQISFQGKLDKAKAAGLCDCWPIKGDHPTVKPIKRVEADTPTTVLADRGSGFVILEADVTDTGKPTNIKVVSSWPEGVYDKKALDAFKQWEYPAKSGSEPANFRKGVVAPFAFIVYDRSNYDTY